VVRPAPYLLHKACAAALPRPHAPLLLNGPMLPWFPGRYLSVPQTVPAYSLDVPRTLPGCSPNVPWRFPERSLDVPRTFPGCSLNPPRKGLLPCPPPLRKPPPAAQPSTVGRLA
jgi:hypothetical protein